MSIEIKLPEVVSGFESGQIDSWLVKEGDTVTKGDILFEVETDKAVIEVESPNSGVIEKILVGKNDGEVIVNSTVALITGSDNPTKHNIDQSCSSDKIGEHSINNKRVLASPAARRVASKNNIDLTLVLGSGPKQRILKSDVEKTIANTSISIKKDSENKEYTTTESINKSVDFDIMDKDCSEGMIPHSNMRKVIAKRLTESKTTIPHFYLSIECNVDKLNELRNELNSECIDSSYKLTINDFIIKSVAMAISKHPQFNAHWNERGIIPNSSIDISVAVSSDEGLMTPIVKSADKKGLVNISNTMKDLVNKTKNGKLKPNEYQGGSFTISNLGMYDIDSFSAIINPPQSAILAVSSAKEVPIVERGEIKIATIMNCTLSVDHRILDGSVAALFLQTFKRFIENPKQVLLYSN
ncbi:dihydrolipoamide acetyltransferase family protein [Vibrio crassostreae]|uniref:dihydrolipoamide acetyltransferase family protein n=1 Tax=Vibrio crassostreae TaxID=246167 RepID=UPI001B3166C3|nr:dihydrolipoamide acetyltransferase family protein [Vibrio crassostreae]